MDLSLPVIVLILIGATDNLDKQMSDHTHVNRTKLFAVIFAILLGLTILSFGVANSSLMDHPVRGWTAMLVISVAKAILVIVFFMHLKWESNWKFVLTIPAAVMSALLVLVLIPDIGNRTKSYSNDRQKFAAYEVLDVASSSSADQSNDAETLGESSSSKKEASPSVAAAQSAKSNEKITVEKSYDDVPGEWGHLKGRFIASGEIPVRKEIVPDKDKNACELPMYSRDLVVGSDRGIKNIVVFLTKPSTPLAIHPFYDSKMSQPVSLDNQRCRFEPHITLMTTKQILSVKNSDEVGHNANITSFNDPNSHNVGIPAGAHVDVQLPLIETRPITVSCTAHAWMKGYIMVRDEPYMAITSKTGEFEIKYLPAGEWQIQFWHENAGYVKSAVAGGKTITVGRKGLVDVTIKDKEVFDLGQIEIPASDLQAK